MRVNLSMGVIVEANELILEGRIFKRNFKVKPKEVQPFIELSEELVRQWTGIDHEKYGTS